MCKEPVAWLGTLLSIFLSGTAAAGDMARAEVVDNTGKGVGAITLTDTSSGVLVAGRLHDLSPGPHAIHFHAVGLCEAPFDSAGGHFNPGGAKRHGFLNEAGPHAGDLPNIHVPDSGVVDFEFLAPNITLRLGQPSTLTDQDGASIVIHAGADDYQTDPAGASGSRVACGVIKR